METRILNQEEIQNIKEKIQEKDKVPAENSIQIQLSRLDNLKTILEEHPEIKVNYNPSLEEQGYDLQLIRVVNRWRLWSTNDYFQTAGVITDLNDNIEITIFDEKIMQAAIGYDKLDFWIRQTLGL